MMLPELKLGRLMTLQESQSAAIERIRERPNLWKAKVTIELPARDLHVSAQRGRNPSWHTAFPLVDARWPMLFPQLERTEHHFEVLHEHRQAGFVLRVVRRGIAKGEERRRYDLAELLFRVPADVPDVWYDHRGVRKPIPFETAMTPDLLVFFLAAANDARVFACGSHIDFTGLRYGHTVIHRGSRPFDLLS